MIENKKVFFDSKSSSVYFYAGYLEALAYFDKNEYGHDCYFNKVNLSFERQPKPNGDYVRCSIFRGGFKEDYCQIHIAFEDNRGSRRINLIKSLLNESFNSLSTQLDISDLGAFVLQAIRNLNQELFNHLQSYHIRNKNLDVLCVEVEDDR
ncbi:hypothetical protein [Enterobacter hormaechei]|uniref:hypothetical protein n=1 Tax=Enterobacter hormaechei TaxID=158836 RepID=UPI0023B09B34|nr:hypothetical protein [Enterobacter hormaechei]MDE7845104.1 hypothetical protein [Enterobacter hormaechei]